MVLILLAEKIILKSESIKDQMKKIAIFSTQRTIGMIIENWFVQNILLPSKSICLDWDLENLKDRVVVYVEVEEIDLKIIDKLKENNNKVVLFQMGDETAKKFNRDAYDKVDFIIRNYYFSEIFDVPEFANKLIWIPNGYKTGIGPRDPTGLRLADQRKFLSSFLGWLDNPNSFGNERHLFREISAECSQDLLIHSTPSFASGFNAGLYSAIMEYSVYCPCPAGNNPSSIRMYDALELGCIPISLKHEYLLTDQAMGPVPFPLLNTWLELPEFLRNARANFLNDSKLVNQLQKDCMDWWSIAKDKWKGQIIERLQSLH